MEKEKYFICRHCGELATQTEIVEYLECGGSSDCGCEFMTYMWDDETITFQPIYFREYNVWFQIPQDIYDALKKQKNAVLRLEMLRTIPANVIHGWKLE